MNWLGSEASVYPVNRVWNELHSHERRDEDWTVVSGSGRVVLYVEKLQVVSVMSLRCLLV